MSAHPWIRRLPGLVASVIVIAVIAIAARQGGRTPAPTASLDQNYGKRILAIRRIGAS